MRTRALRAVVIAAALTAAVVGFLLLRPGEAEHQPQTTIEQALTGFVGDRFGVGYRTRSKADDLAREIGAEVAATPREAAQGAEAVVTMLADFDALRAAYQGEDGAAAGLRRDAAAIDMGTTGPAGVRWLADEVQAVGAKLVDAPVSGSTATATQGKLTIMAGGPPDAFERVEPLLRAMGSRVYHLGPTGAGAAMKLAVNSIIYSLGEALSEALVLAEQSGIDPTVAYDVFEHSAVAAPMVGYRHEQFVRPDEAPVLFAMTLAEKDLRLIDDLANDVGAPMPQARANLATYAEAVAAGFGERDMAGVLGYLRELAGRSRPAE